MRFDLVDLRLFCDVAEAGSITHGAERSALALASASGSGAATFGLRGGTGKAHDVIKSCG